MREWRAVVCEHNQGNLYARQQIEFDNIKEGDNYIDMSAMTSEPKMTKQIINKSEPNRRLLLHVGYESRARKVSATSPRVF